LAGSNALTLLEDLAEIAGHVVAELEDDLRNLQIGLQQQLFRSFDPAAGQVFEKTLSGLLLEQLTEVVGTQAAVLSGILEGDPVLEISPLFSKKLIRSSKKTSRSVRTE